MREHPTDTSVAGCRQMNLIWYQDDHQQKCYAYKTNDLTVIQSRTVRQPGTSHEEKPMICGRGQKQTGIDNKGSGYQAQKEQTCASLRKPAKVCKFKDRMRKGISMLASKIAGEARGWLQGIGRNEFLHADAQGIERIRPVGAGLQLILFCFGQLFATLILLVVVYCSSRY